jgi:hypothetical protein
MLPPYSALEVTNVIKAERCGELGPTWLGDFALLGTTVDYLSPPTS